MSGHPGGTGTGRLTAVCVVHEILPDAGTVGRTAIDKRAVPHAVQVGELGLAGDTQCDTDHHGGPEQALYAYADEDAAAWARELGRQIPPGLFGENLRVGGIEVTGAEIGERWRIGDEATGVLVEVTCPRIPCQTFTTRMGEKSWVKRFTDHGAPGAYLAVVAGGSIAEGDAVTVVHRPGHGVTVGALFPFASPQDARALLDAADAGVVDLGPKVRDEVGQMATRG